MRRFVLGAIALLLAATSASAESLTVRLDQNTRIRLSAPARDVVVGNPAIADVSVLGPRDLVVLGKTYGVTNLLVVDARGRTIFEREIVVASPEASVSVFRGAQMRSYACGARCEQVTGGDSGGASPNPAPPTP
jgi:Flp pilus assembly secretin CpaC